MHVFAAINGNHRIVEAAVELKVPVVLSALVSPGWNRSNGTRARVADRVLGNLIAWDVQTSYAQTRQALHLASLVVALCESEKQAIRNAFLINPAKVRVLPNGISPHFFEADPALFRARTEVKGQFALMVGAVSPYKNQLGMAQTLSEMALPFVVIGEAQERDTDYLRRLRAVPGVICLGSLRQQERMLASAFAAATVFVLPSQGEVVPSTVLEALAAGTPVVMTEASALHLPNSEFALRQGALGRQPGAERRAARPARGAARTRAGARAGAPVHLGQRGAAAGRLLRRCGGAGAPRQRRLRRSSSPWYTGA